MYRGVSLTVRGYGLIMLFVQGGWRAAPGLAASVRSSLPSRVSWVWAAWGGCVRTCAILEAPQWQ